MKKNYKRALLSWLLTLAMLIPVMNAAIVPAIGAIAEGDLKNVDMSMFDGLMAPAEKATINIENSGGIRFATNINLEKYAAFKSFCKSKLIKGVSFGTIIAPVEYVKEAGKFTTEKLDTLPYKTPYLDIKANNEAFYDGAKTVAPGYDEQFVASLINIKLENRTRDFAAIGYIQLTTVTNGIYTIYSYDNENMALVEKYAANLAEVAADALQQDTWTDDERAKIADLVAEETKWQIDTTRIKDVRTKRSQVFFTFVNNSNQKFYNRITYDGANGWRLQTNAKGYNCFKDIGAGQSLALYMSEGFYDDPIPLTVTQGQNNLVIRAEGSDTYATITTTTGKIDFCSADGESLYNVNTMSQNNTGEIVLKGKMNATEAVYGGGESFDATNKRGKYMSLYISDAYDASGTYVAVPLFSTSRGGGMFVNRYEPMTIRFPDKNVADNWELTIDAETVDCYFYATGNISDVLQAYVNMTGHASLPEEWAQGYLVCRYAPDFNSLNDVNGKTEGVYWRYELPNPESYSYTPHQPLTAEIAAKLGNNASIQDKAGKITYYTHIAEGNGDANGNGIRGEKYFRSETEKNVYYYSYEDLPNKDVLYYDNQTRVKLSENSTDLCHKKTVSANANNQYHYIIEDDTQDFNYNGITGETYFLRVGTRSGPGGAGVTHIVESLIGAGMKPTGVILEGAGWYDIAGNGSNSAAQWASVKNFVQYLDSQNIKTLVYTSLGHVTGSSMHKDFKSEYKLSVDIYNYNASTGIIGTKIKTTQAIPKSDETNNPDTASDGTQVYLDITNPAAVKWYVDSVWSVMMDLGIDGIKIDFCESMPNEGEFTMKIDGTDQKVYLKHNWYDPTVFGDADPHHAYPSFFVSMFYKAMEEKAAQRADDTGFVVLTRGGGIGAQRNPYLWAGDQSRTFGNLKTQLAAVINSGISGIPFMTYDMGGYAYSGSSYHYYGGQVQTIRDSGKSFYLADLQAAEEYESEIFVRALQFTTFGNLIQTHGFVRHVYQMTEEAQQIAALYNALHEELAGYLQKMSQIACDTGMPMIRHMILQYQNDANVADIDNQFMYGDALLVAPIQECNTTKDSLDRDILTYASTVTRDIYLPAGTWIDLNTRETIVSTGQTISVSANLAKTPLYLNTASEYAAELQEIFAGETWQAIQALANAQ